MASHSALLFLALVSLSASAYGLGFEDWFVAFSLLAVFVFIAGLVLGPPIFIRILAWMVITAGVVVGAVAVVSSRFNPIGFALAIIIAAIALGFSIFLGFLAHSAEISRS